MYINHDDLAAMATGGAGVLMLKAMDRERDALQRQVSKILKKTLCCLAKKYSHVLVVIFTICLIACMFDLKVNVVAWY